jgi:hypothetical protein
VRVASARAPRARRFSARRLWRSQSPRQRPRRRSAPARPGRAARGSVSADKSARAAAATDWVVSIVTPARMLLQGSNASAGVRFNIGRLRELICINPMSTEYPCPISRSARRADRAVVREAAARGGRGPRRLAWLRRRYPCQGEVSDGLCTLDLRTTARRALSQRRSSPC